MFGLKRFALMSTIDLDEVQGLMMESGVGHQNSYSTHHNSIVFGLNRVALTSTFNLDEVQGLMMESGAGHQNS